MATTRPPSGSLGPLTLPPSSSGSDTPNWAPLRALLPLEDCDGFMWMGTVLQPGAVYVHGRYQDRVIFQYKHGITATT